MRNNHACMEESFLEKMMIDCIFYQTPQVNASVRFVLDLLDHLGRFSDSRYKIFFKTHAWRQLGEDCEKQSDVPAPGTPIQMQALSRRNLSSDRVLPCKRCFHDFVLSPLKSASSSPLEKSRGNLALITKPNEIFVRQNEILFLKRQPPRNKGYYFQIRIAPSNVESARKNTQVQDYILAVVFRSPPQFLCNFARSALKHDVWARLVATAPLAAIGSRLQRNDLGP